MLDHHPGWTDTQIDTIIGNLLRIGVVVASATILVGGTIYLVRHGAAQPDYRVFHGEPADLRDLPGIAQDALSFSGRGLIQLGLLFLIATPVARVVFSIVAFTVQRDRIYVIVTLIVLAILLYSLVGPHPTG
jgi:uncharacterized membrane protein